MGTRKRPNLRLDRRDEGSSSLVDDGKDVISNVDRVEDEYAKLVDMRDAPIEQTPIWESYHKTRINLGILMETAVQGMLGKGKVDVGDLKVLVNCFKDLQTSDPFYRYVVEKCARDAKAKGPNRRRDGGGGVELRQADLGGHAKQGVTIEAIIKSSKEAVVCEDEYAQRSRALVEDMLQEGGD